MSEFKNFTAKHLLKEEGELLLSEINIRKLLEVGEIAKSLGLERGLPIAVEVRLGDWTIYHASLPESTVEN